MYKIKFRLFFTGLALGALLAVGTLRLFPHGKETAQATVGDVTIDQSVGGTATFGTVNFQKIQDTANTSYFLDPAATGTSLMTAGGATVAGTVESTTGCFKFPDATTPDNCRIGICSRICRITDRVVYESKYGTDQSDLDRQPNGKC